MVASTLFAFGLLEALRIVGMDFVFKGGTSLLLPHPKRLSTDIDIVVEPNSNVDEFIEKASQIFPFITKEEHFEKKKKISFLYTSIDILLLTSTTILEKSKKVQWFLVLTIVFLWEEER